jgi:mono/diheme cytochrome c family protein
MLRNRELVLALCTGAVVALISGRSVQGADEAGANVAGTFRKYCFQCHGNGAAMAGVSLQQLIAKPSVGENSQMWEKVAGAVEQNRMPPKGLPQPSDAERAHAASWIRSELAAFAKKNAGDPGRVTVRRLTSGEYDYAIQDLTGFDLDTGIDATTDSVGGEGFTNFGDVQFMQDATLERYLAAAKGVAEHAVIGAGPLGFYQDPGKTGFEMSAIARIRDIYNRNGFRTVSGEGGVPFGLEKYGKAFDVAWRYQYRKALGEPAITLDQLAAKEGISPRFAKHIWGVMNNSTLAYPSSEVAARWRKLPAPGGDLKASTEAARAACTDLQKYTTTWPSWLFARGDVAAGGAGDESPLVFSDASLRVQAKHHFTFLRGGRGGAGRGAPPPGPAKIFLNVAQVNPAATGKPSIIWRNPTISFRQGGPGRGQAQTAQAAAGDAAAAQDAAAQDGAAGQNPLRRLPPGGPRQPLRTVVSEETAKRLGFGKSIDATAVGPDDFASDSSVWFEVPLPQGITVFDIQVDAEVGADRDQVYRITVTDREDGGARGIPTRTLLGDPQSNGYRTFKAGVMQFASLMPPNSHNEPTPADKDPIPEPFDSTYNVPEHDEFDTRVKYIRDDHFVYQNILDDADRLRVDQAWNDLYSSFAYHDNYLDLIAKHYKLDLKGKHISDLDKAQIEALPAEPAKYILPLRADYEKSQAAEAAARPHHLEDCLKFASEAWRRPLSEREKQSLRTFYDKTMTAEGDHRKAIRAVLARILVAPAFLYRVEQPVDSAAVKPLSDWDMASRLSFFLWSSIPDSELRRAAGAGELSNPQMLEKQLKRMLADPKARRLATEFFGQWLGFYHFDQFRGVDTGRFPEFTDEVRSSMYDEAVSFFEHLIRKDRPVREMLTADYDFLNKPLAKYYGVNKEIKSTGPVELVENANTFQRGGVLRLGAMLTTTSAPLRTSPVKRGDWVLRRILGTAVPPPPADAGSIPADDKLFGGLSVREKLEVHKRNATCANCHLRIDPLGFPLERYDSTGRWRDKYTDGKPIWDTGTFGDKTEIAGVQGLLDYLRSKDEQVRRTLSYKLLGYALGRTVQLSDQPLIDKMVAAGPDSTMTQLAAEIVTSRQFRNRLGREDGTTVARNSDPKQSEKAGGR